MLLNDTKITKHRGNHGCENCGHLVIVEDFPIYDKKLVVEGGMVCCRCPEVVEIWRTNFAEKKRHNPIYNSLIEKGIIPAGMVCWICPAHTNPNSRDTPSFYAFRDEGEVPVIGVRKDGDRVFVASSDERHLKDPAGYRSKEKMVLKRRKIDRNFNRYMKYDQVELDVSG
jgi:hypothetical protein